MAEFSTLRKKWTDARDAAKIKKGAVSGVSMGDAIDAVVKAQAKGYGSVLKALEALTAAMTKYKAKLPKDSSAVKWLDTVLAKEIKDYQGNIKLDIGNIGWINQYPLGDTIMSSYGFNPDSANYSTTEAILAKANKPKAKDEEEESEGESDEADKMTWKEAAEEAKLFFVTNACLPRVGKRALDMSKLVWNAKLPGHDADYTAIKDWSGALLEDVKYCAKWVKVEDGMAFLNMMRAWGQRDNAYSYDAALKKALADLSK